MANTRARTYILFEMKKITLLLISLICLINYSCVNKTDISDISNSKTDKHFNIPKTRLFIVPPSGFLTDKATPAIWKDSTGIIQVIDMDGDDFESSTFNIGKKGFKALGFKVLAYNELKVGDYSGRISVVNGYYSANPSMQSYYLVFGDSSFCSVVIGSYKIGDKETAKQVFESLKTICFLKSSKVPAPFESVNFKLDDSKSILKFATYSGAMFIYTKDGKDCVSYPTLMVSTLPRNTLSIKQYADHLYKQMKVNGLKITDRGSEIIDKTNGFESFLSVSQVIVEKKEYTWLVHIVIIDNNFIVMQGFADKDDLESIDVLKKLTNTISKKTSTGHNTNKTTCA